MQKRGIGKVITVVVMIICSIAMFSSMALIVLNEVKQKTTVIDEKIVAASSISLNINSVYFIDDNLYIQVENRGQQDITSFAVRVTSSSGNVYLNNSVYLKNKEKLGPLNRRDIIIIPAPFGNISSNYSLIEVYPKFEYKNNEQIAENGKSEVEGNRIADTGEGSNPINLISFDDSSYNLFISPSGSDTNSGSEDSPFATLDKARDSARLFPADKPVNIYLRGGAYYLSSAFNLDERDSRDSNSPVTYQSYPGENVIISGGREISGFTRYNSNIYQLNIDSSHYFRQLFINDVRATRARTQNPSASYKWLNSDSPFFLLVNVTNPPFNTASYENYSFQVPVGILGNFRNINDIEVIALMKWDNIRERLKSVDTIGNRIYLMPPNFVNPMHNVEANDRAYLENALEFLDSPGEWYYDNQAKILYYYPSGDELSGQIIIPQLTQLINISGKRDNKVRNIYFKNLTFEHTDVYLDPAGYQGGQAAIPSFPNQVKSSAAVSAIYMENSGFENCEFKNLGGTGLDIGRGSSNNLISNNIFSEIGANCISLGEIEAPSSELDRVDGNKVVGNTISRCGKDYYSGLGIFAPYVSNTEISGNEVFDLPYTGISLGWWTMSATVQYQNTVSSNKVHDVMKLMSDGGAIYTLGNQPGTMIKDNILCNIYRNSYRGAGNRAIDLDDASMNMDIENNIIKMKRKTESRDGQPYDATVYYCTPIVWSATSSNLVFSNNKIYWDGEGLWGNRDADGNWINAGPMAPADNVTFIGNQQLSLSEWPYDFCTENI